MITFLNHLTISRDVSSVCVETQEKSNNSKKKTGKEEEIVKTVTVYMTFNIL